MNRSPVPLSAPASSTRRPSVGRGAVPARPGPPWQSWRPLVRLALAGGLVVALAGCGSSATSTSSAAPTSSAAASTSATTGLSLKDGWAKSAPSGMTAIFGTLDNPTGQDITVMSGTSPVADMVQLHEVVTVNGASKMQPKVGGFLVPAHGSHVLKPGGDHIMVMGLKKAIRAGDTVAATLTLKDGSTVQITAIGKDFAGANETYASPGAGTQMSPGTSMSGARPSMSPSS